MKSKITIISILLILLVVVLYFTYLPKVNITPNITDISPKLGPVGTEVTLTGNGFDTSKFKDGRSTRLFISGPYKQSVDERHDGEVIDLVTNNQIKFKIPSEALFGKHSITISNPIDSNEVEFEVIDNNSK